MDLDEGEIKSCPECGTELDFMGEFVECSGCGRRYPASMWTFKADGIRPLTFVERWFGGPYKREGDF